MINSIILGAIGVCLAGVSVYAHIKTRGEIGEGWGVCAFLFLLVALFSL